MSDLKTWVQNQAKKLAPWQEAAYFESTASTNDEAMAYHRGGGLAPALFVAKQQSAGRGRLGRSWESMPGKGLYFSLLLHPRLPAAQAPLIPLAVGLALKQALEKWSVSGLLLKWPNDVWIQGKKLAGVLSELAASGSEVEAVVVGVGINVSQGAEDFSEELRSHATSLAQSLQKNIPASELLEAVLPALLGELERLVQDGPEALIQRWERDSGMVGIRVSVRDEAGEFSGEVLGLEHSGALRVRRDDGKTRQIIAADVMPALL